MYDVCLCTTDTHRKSNYQLSFVPHMQPGDVNLRNIHPSSERLAHLQGVEETNYDRRHHVALHNHFSNTIQNPASSRVKSQLTHIYE